MLELVDEVDHVLAHRRAADSVDESAVFEPGVLRLAGRQRRRSAFLHEPNKQRWSEAEAEVRTRSWVRTLSQSSAGETHGRFRDVTPPVLDFYWLQFASKWLHALIFCLCLFISIYCLLPFLLSPCISITLFISYRCLQTIPKLSEKYVLEN